MAALRTERRLAAILATDIVGYSRMIETDEAATLDAIRLLRSKIIDPLIAEHNGRLVKLMGDGAIFEFGSVVDAVASAVAIQKGVAVEQAEVSPERRIILRCGLNLGDVVVEADDLLGDGVNVAARLEQLCEPGGILVSGTAYDHLQGKLGLPLDFTGEHHVKNMARPVRSYRVRLDGVRGSSRLRLRQHQHQIRMFAAAIIPLLLILAGGAWLLWPVDSSPAKPAVAVLPFNNYGDEATGRLADGLTEDIITDLARFPEFEVVARNSTEVYKGKPIDARQIGTALRVGYVLQGSIQRQGGRVRITAQLIDAKSGHHLWSDRWDRPAEDVFAVQTEIAEHVTNRLGGGVGLIQAAGRDAAKRKRPENLNAYDYYLLGTEKIEKITQADEEEAIALLNRAIELDPGLARAWVELFHAHSLLASFGVNPENERVAAADAAKQAVLLDPNDAEAHAVFGMSLGDKGDMANAKAEMDTSLRLAPGSAEILTFYAMNAARFGEPVRGGQMVDQVIRLDPNYPMWASGPFSYAYFMAGRYEDALEVLERLTPDHYNDGKWVVRAGSLAALGQIDEAKASATEAVARFPDTTIEGFTSQPGVTSAERQRLIETMRLAGFPPCADPEALARIAKPVRLPECLKG